MISFLHISSIWWLISGKKNLYLSDLKLTVLLSTSKQIIKWGNFSQKTPYRFLAGTRLIVAHPLLHLDLAARQVVGCFDNRISYSLVELFLFRPVPNIRLDLNVTGLSYLKTMNSPCKLCQKQILDNSKKNVFVYGQPLYLLFSNATNIRWAIKDFQGFKATF